MKDLNYIELSNMMDSLGYTEMLGVDTPEAVRIALETREYLSTDIDQVESIAEDPRQMKLAI